MEPTNEGSVRLNDGLGREHERMNMCDRAIQSDWERAHELLDKHGVLATPRQEVGHHLIERIEAVLKVWDAVGQMSGASCHDLRFLCNTSDGQVEAIEAHRAAYRAA